MSSNSCSRRAGAGQIIKIFIMKNMTWTRAVHIYYAVSVCSLCVRRQEFRGIWRQWHSCNSSIWEAETRNYFQFVSNMGYIIPSKPTNQTKTQTKRERKTQKALFLSQCWILSSCPHILLRGPSKNSWISQLLLELLHIFQDNDFQNILTRTLLKMALYTGVYKEEKQNSSE